MSFELSRAIRESLTAREYLGDPTQETLETLPLGNKPLLQRTPTNRVNHPKRKRTQSPFEGVFPR
jgi:hypothetical protein